ncbi:Putative teichuronic acid biosynthesis glycosyltransferase TuaH [Vibrio aerogenes CECT 7868]|uniref:Putative teichuronic acid biosynthesis glycosyltransferase TuaH n=1 Tax=Vibrio aerogenes CECT 7868 TaxID=1216006 RepID=A0A1M5ZB23_9VIBR|nr:glycosyltransferase [Vibrio aerogenes]SHI21338.1 Putative teichuronic acid biosynthesis glycosyltransferase TuaH [Vibrio aerogenes CECT 7868]
MRDFIVFGEDFGGLPSSTQHLISHFPEHCRILWVNSIGLRQPRLSRHDIRRAVHKLFRVSKPAYQYEEKPPATNISVVNLVTIPAPRSRWARTIAREIMQYQLRIMIKEFRLNKPVLWTSLPTAADLCGKLGESHVVYYCGDDFSALEGVDHQTISRHEADLVSKADLILAASPALQNKFPAEKTCLLPHGVDTELFSTPVTRAQDLPQHGPVAGFYGSLSSWLDDTLIGQVAKALPHWQFVFIGPQTQSRPSLPELPNIHLLGPRAHHQLPAYCQHWDVSLLPFILNQQIQACSPLKLMEYLAAGRPVVTTDYPAIEPYRLHLNVTDSAESMIDTLRRYECNPDSLNIAPATIVRQESWQRRSHVISQLLELL